MEGMEEVDVPSAENSCSWSGAWRSSQSRVSPYSRRGLGWLVVLVYLVWDKGRVLDLVDLVALECADLLHVIDHHQK